VLRKGIVLDVSMNYSMFSIPRLGSYPEIFEGFQISLKSIKQASGRHQSAENNSF
jgi:hypothetical protein